MKKQDFLAKLQNKQTKFADLVWFARSYREDIKDDRSSMPNMIRIQMALTEDVENIMGDDGDWHHGFNSGCLAAFRYALALLGSKEEAAAAEEDFPFLDT